MIASILIITALFVTISMATVAAWSDFKTMQIDNNISIIISIAFLIALGLDFFILSDVHIFETWWSGLAAGIITLIVTFLMFTVGMIGGGDSKLASALALWIGLKGLAAFLFYMSITGGILALITVIFRNKKSLKPLAKVMGEKSWIAAIYNNKNALPYGIAILIGCLGAFARIELFPNLYTLTMLVFVAP